MSEVNNIPDAVKELKNIPSAYLVTLRNDNLVINKEDSFNALLDYFNDNCAYDFTSSYGANVVDNAKYYINNFGFFGKNMHEDFAEDGSLYLRSLAMAYYQMLEEKARLIYLQTGDGGYYGSTEYLFVFEVEGLPYGVSILENSYGETDPDVRNYFDPLEVYTEVVYRYKDNRYWK